MTTSTDRVGQAEAVRGAVIGAGAFLLGYLVTYVWRAQAVNESLQGLNVLADLLGLTTIPTWKGVGWLFYGAHGVTTRFPTLAGGTEMVNLVEQSGDGTVALLYLLVPLLLAIAGAAAATLADADTPAAGALTGATVTIGYGVLAAIGTVGLSHAIGDTGATIAPDPVTGVLLAGLVYPVAFGAIGGAAAGFR